MMLELFKEKKINPFGSIGLALLQFPILIALFFVLREITNPAQFADQAYSFIAGLGPIKAIIANPSSFNPTLFGVVHMANPNIVLAVLAGITQFVQARQLTPRNQTQTMGPANIGFTMTLIFPILTVAIASKLPSALALYWATSSFVAIIQQQVVLSEDVSWMERLSLKRFRKNGASQ
jgi:YidC/Oxa1 family membrane protein insertase